MEGLTADLLNLMDRMVERKVQQMEFASDCEERKDAYGYAFEPYDTFRADPLGFTEKVMTLQAEAEEVFPLTRTVNRFSPLYIKLTRQLEKLLAQLGSCCITKAVLEQQGKTFSALDDLSIEGLRGMLGLNFRKCFEAFMEKREANGLNYEALEMSVRFSALDRRLEATEAKIQKIRSGKCRIETSADERESRDDGKTLSAPAEASDPKPAAFSANARALPVSRGTILSESSAPAEPEANRIDILETQEVENPAADGISEASGSEVPEIPVGTMEPSPETVEEFYREFAEKYGEIPEDDVIYPWDPGWDDMTIPYVSDALVERMAEKHKHPQVKIWVPEDLPPEPVPI